MKKFIVTVFLLFLAASAPGQEMTAGALKAMGAPNHPKVEIAWNRYYDSEQIGDLCRRLAEAHPGLIRHSVIGTSVQGRPLNMLTVTNFDVGEADGKPAMYIDGNIHSNEIQGAEVALYTAWYLAESCAENDWIAQLLDEKTFYIIPTINPDARDDFVHHANTPHSPRSGMAPRDDDGDGLVDEDPMDDLDHDGNIVMMRRKSPYGRWRVDADDSRLLVRAKADEPGQYELLGWEGVDNDGDGRINEDGPGYYDPNRNWAWQWQPSHIQYGADRYPFSIPEDRAVADFVLQHPNIAGAQSYHNAGGMILRGPGAAEDSAYVDADKKVYDNIGKTGEEMLPGYRYLVLYKDLYPAYGGELDWFYGARGIFTFTNELWTPFDYFRKAEKDAGYFGREKDVYRFDELLLFREGVVDWKPIKHPQFGDIEIGGVKKAWTRMPPSFMIEDMCHRNMAFTLYHAYHLPSVRIDSVSIVKQQGYYKIDAIISNSRMTPTRSAHEIKDNMTPPDIAAIVGADVVAGMVVTDPLMDLSREQKYLPNRLRLDAVPAMGMVQVRWLCKTKPGEVVFTSAKGGAAVFRIP